MTPLIDIEYLRNNIDPGELSGLIAGSDPASDDNKIWESAIKRAHSVLAATLKSKYKYPFDGPEEDLEYLKGIEFKLARYYLYGREYNDDEMKVYYIQYNKAHKELEQLKKGEIILGLEKSSNFSITPGIITNKKATDKVYNDDFYEGYR